MLSRITQELETSRSESEIVEVIGELLDKVWYNRHLFLREQIEAGKESVDPKIWKDALESARKVERQYGKAELGPWDDFEWGRSMASSQR